MKKLICIILTLACLSLTVYANPNMMGDVGNIDIKKASPTIDGNITDSEGWSEGVYAYKDIMATFGNTNDILQSFYLYYAYDEEGIYYAADIIDNTFVLSTGEDDIDNVVNDFNIKNENVYGYNGDIFTFTMDPLGLFIDDGYTQNTDYNSWYSVGIFEGNICRMYRGHNRSGDVTDIAPVAGKTTDAGWCFEAFIPWEELCRDAEEMSYGDVSVTPEEMCENGAKHRAMAIYMDRFYDEEAEEVTTFQRFATCGYILPDGLLGYLSSGVCLKAYGITLTVVDPEGEANAETTVSAEEDNITTEGEQENNTTASGDTAKPTDNKGNTVTKPAATTKPQSNQTASAEASAQTGDIGIGIAIGAIAVAVVGFIFAKKKLK